VSKNGDREAEDVVLFVVLLARFSNLEHLVFPQFINHIFAELITFDMNILQKYKFHHVMQEGIYHISSFIMVGE